MPVDRRASVPVSGRSHARLRAAPLERLTADRRTAWPIVRSESLAVRRSLAGRSALLGIDEQHSVSSRRHSSDTSDSESALSSRIETTGLLMKELDNLRTDDGPSLEARASLGSPTDERRARLAALQRRPSEPQSVARAILQAVRSKVKQRHTGRRAAAPTKQSSSPHSREVEFPIATATRRASAAVVSNGHANASNAECAQPSSSPKSQQRSARSKAHKNRFHLDFRPGSRQRRHSQSPVDSSQSATTSRPPSTFGSERPTSLPTTDGESSRKDSGEHKLIAINSALLQVTPQSPTHQTCWTTPDSPQSCGAGRAASPACEADPKDGPSSSATCAVDAETRVELPRCCGETSPTSERFLQHRNRECTSYRLQLRNAKNPVDVCVLPKQCLAVADYDNGYLVLNAAGDLDEHCARVADGRSACCVVARQSADDFRVLVLGYKDGAWTVSSYGADWAHVETIACPDDAHIEAWARRKLALPADGALYLLASGEHKSVIWCYDFGFGTWKVVLTENSRKGCYNDMAVRWDADRRETLFLLCDWKKAHLCLVAVSEESELAGVQTIKMRRVKGQEWVVQGPKLVCWDEHADLLVYDGSGKLFLFDGARFRCKRIVADLGRGEVGAIAARDGWCFALCRHRLHVEAFLYRTSAETDI